MKLRDKRLLIILVMVVLISCVGLLFLKINHKTLTGYEDANGWIYECSKPISAKIGTAATLGHPQGFIPTDASEATRYCHKVGIE